MDEREYVVAIKRSARKRCAAVGEWVAAHGSRRSFRSKYAARRWADRVSEAGRRVWVQDANPADESDVDGYLVGGERVPGGDPDDDPEWWEPAGQVPIGAYDGR